MSIKQQKDGVYIVRVQIDGQRIKKTVRGTRKEAEQIELEIKRRLHQTENNAFLGKAPACTYGEACLKWGKNGAPQSMHSHIRNTLIYLKDVNLTDVPEYATHMKEVFISNGLSNQTVNRRLACVRRVLNLAYREWGLLDFPLAEKISLLSERNTARYHYLTTSEIGELIAACRSPVTADFIKLAAYTGLRRSELLAIHCTDFQDGYLTVNQSKSGKRRTVPVPRNLWPICQSLPFDLTEAKLRRDFEIARKLINRPEIRLHDLRHSYATLLMRKGVSASVLRDILGHSSLSVTSRYAHGSSIDIDKVLEN